MKKAIAVFLLCASVFAASSQIFSFQGKLLDNNGAAVTGTKSIAYELYTVASGGSPLKTWPAQSTAIQGGLYVSELDMRDVDLSAESDMYLSVSVEGQALSPRVHLSSSIFAQKATTANALQGTNYVITQAGIATLSSLTVTNTVTANKVIGAVWQ